MKTPTLYFFPVVVLFLLLSIACSAKTHRNIITDQAVLLSFKAQITLDPHNILQSNWSNSSSVCGWIGVTCSLRHHRVTALNISSMNVTGTIPAQLGNLSFLASLDLSDNNFLGDLPEQLANLHRLQVIILNNNGFSGQIPAWLGSLSELRGLSLAYNSFAGFIPPSISNLTKLETLWLSTNFLEGEIPIDICHSLPRLKRLYLSSNAFVGQIPSSISNCSELQQLSLSYNSFSGGIPGEIGKLEKLELLFLGGNGFSEGVIPQEIGNLRNLKWLAMEETQRVGSIPPEIRKLEKLEALYLNGNGFSKGVIPQEIGNLRNLKELAMQDTQRIGSIPLALFNISALQYMDLSINDLEGEIPEEIGQLYQLEEIRLYSNILSGFIPMGIFNMSNLRVLFLATNQLMGTLPSNMGYGLPHLEKLYLFENNLGGVVPNSISNSTRLKRIQLQDNYFMGEIPDSLGDLRLLNILDLSGNSLTSPGLKFITSLTKCQHLQALDVSRNLLDGNFPVSVGNLSALEKFWAKECKIRGSIPNEFGNLRKLIQLNLLNNHLTGPIPATMKALQFLDLANNSIQGSTLYTLCELQNLFFLNLDHNNISGTIPNCLHKVISLQHLSIHNSALTSIPPSLWNLKNLIWLNLSSNSINGSLPKEIGKLKVAVQIDLSMNQFTRNIPNVFIDLLNLESLFLSHNRLGGSIPDLLGKAISLKDLDLSHNNLLGSIPKSLEALKYLKNFNVSFNNLGGQIPSDGPFKNFTSQSFLSNDALCGDSRFKVPPCPISSTNEKRLKRTLQLILIPLGIAMTILAMAFIFLLMRYPRKEKDSRRLESFFATTLERISYYELFEATNKYNESNLLGSGSFGSVYRGVLKNGTCVAVKVFNLHLEGAFKSFETECQVLRGLRHRNLTKVITSCCTKDFKGLVLQYISNGNLEKWLYSHNYFLNVMQRLNIMIDVAYALEYLHHGYSTPLVHCDLKPSNVLLDENMVGHVSDFGITKLLGEGQSISHTNTLATVGYIAPEYGLEGLVSTRCDVYSFGIMLMEVFTRKKPNDDMFVADLSLRSWVSNFTPHAVIQVVDANLMRPQEQHLSEKLKCLSSIMEVALSCSAESPNERINMRNVVSTLNRIKLEFLANFGGS